MALCLSAASVVNHFGKSLPCPIFSMNERYASGLAVMTETTVAGMADASKARADGSGLKITESSEMNDSREDKAAGPVAVMLPSEALA